MERAEPASPRNCRTAVLSWERASIHNHTRTLHSNDTLASPARIYRRQARQLSRCTPVRSSKWWLYVCMRVCMYYARCRWPRDCMLEDMPARPCQRYGGLLRPSRFGHRQVMSGAMLTALAIPRDRELSSFKPTESTTNANPYVNSHTCARTCRQAHTTHTQTHQNSDLLATGTCL